MHHGAAQVVVERIRDGKEGIGLIALGAKPADVWSGLCEALELTRAVLDECCPGVVMEEWAIGKAGLDPRSQLSVPCVRLAEAKAAHERGDAELTFSGAVHDIAEDLLGASMQQAAEERARLRAMAARGTNGQMQSGGSLHDDGSGSGAGVPYDVFISFRFGEAHKEALALKAALEGHGLRVFLSDTNPGDNLGHIIAEALRGCRLAVLMATRTYGKATNDLFDTGREMKYVLGHKKPFFLTRMIPFGEEWAEAETDLAFPDSLMQELWLPKTPMPDGMDERVAAKLLAAVGSASAPGADGATVASPPAAAPAAAAASLPTSASSAASDPAAPVAAVPTG